jgi:mono/diheme cytochrome c family protein
MRVIAVSLCLIGLLIVGIVVVTGQPTVSASPPAHGTPDPNATPDLDNVLAERIPTYFEDVEPIIEQNCVTCHQAGQIGYEVFPMDTYQDILAYAEDIAWVTGIEYMPPWMPDENSPAFKHDRSLTGEEIHTIADWYAGGAPLGDETKRQDDKLNPTTAAAPDLRVDLELTMSVPYTPDENLTDDYRCFVLDPGFEEDTFITGYNVIPDNTESVHHVIVFQAPAAARTEAAAKSGEDGRPGWQCFGGTNLTAQASAFGTAMVGGWVPGTLAIEAHAGTGVLVPADSIFILQVHYNTLAGVEPDQTTVVFELEPATEDIDAYIAYPVTAPVEIPCPDGMDNNLCDRDTLLAEQGRLRPQVLLRRCGKTIDDYAGMDASHVVSDCDNYIPADGYILGVTPHMHERGKQTSLVLNPDTPEEIVLINIPEWDFHWQGTYQYVEPIPVKAGDTVRLTCIWDNSEGDRYIVWGESTRDEMCITFVEFVPLED